MRELKFRVWNVVYKEFEYSPVRRYLIGLDGRIFDGCGSSYDEFHVAQQFIGKKDKNGKEIYEGDIISYFLRPCDLGECESGIGEVYYDSEVASFLFDRAYEYDFMFNAKNVEVIGNIFENPDLIK